MLLVRRFWIGIKFSQFIWENENTGAYRYTITNAYFDVFFCSLLRRKPEFFYFENIILQPLGWNENKRQTYNMWEDILTSTVNAHTPFMKMFNHCYFILQLNELLQDGGIHCWNEFKIFTKKVSRLTHTVKGGGFYFHIPYKILKR